MSKRKAPIMLSMEKRLQIFEWLKLHINDVPNMSGDEIVKVVSAAINHPCTLQQVRDTVNAGRMHWKVKKTMPVGRSGIAGRMDRMERRLTELEAWCVLTADGLGVKPPEKPTPLPSDEEI